MAKPLPPVTIRMALIFGLVFGAIVLILLVLGAMLNRGACWACGW